LVIFGLESSRKRAYDTTPQLAQLVRKLGVSTLIDVGPGSARPPNIPGVAVSVLGSLAADEISAVLRGARYGLLYYPQEYLAKSSIFAAYASHAVVPIIPYAKPLISDGLVHGMHYIAVNPLQTGDELLERVSGQAFDWYQSHARIVHAAWLEALARGRKP
jgi:hypothetical protein